MTSTNNISPHVYALSAVLVAALSFLGFKYFGGLDDWFFLPIFALVAFWGVANIIRQKRGQSTFHLEKNIQFISLLKRALMRYLVWMVVIVVSLAFFQSHSFYQKYEKSIEFLDMLFHLYLIAGVPYFLLTLVVKASRIEDYYDPAVRFIHIIKQVSRGVLLRQGKPFSVFSKPYNRKVVLNLVMRAYFIPVMVVQVYSNMDNAIRFSTNDFQNYSLMVILFWITALLWFMDALNASVAYCLESRWAENRTRSIDMTVSGWLICLCCYPPVNGVTSTFFPFGPGIVPNNLVIDDNFIIYLVKFIEVVLLSALVYSDLSLGPSGVNITLKRLQTRGPYGVVRHPATVFKLSFWWLQTAVHARFWKSPQLLFGHIAWNVIYILRTVTEERHLRKHKEYRKYMKRVKYRFIPGLI